jgi:hypothetical protein
MEASDRKRCQPNLDHAPPKGCGRETLLLSPTAPYGPAASLDDELITVKFGAGYSKTPGYRWHDPLGSVSRIQKNRYLTPIFCDPDFLH